MTNLQINDITWQRQENDLFNPVLSFYKSESKEFNTIPLDNYNFNFLLSEEKFCTGYYKEGQHFECQFKNVLDAKTASQCAYCERVQGFKSAFIMGDVSHAMSDSILSQQYYIYLGYFEPGIIKVGTANATRGSKRLIEQDCLLYCFIAKGTGYQIQKLEHLISKKLGITETVKSNHKFKYLNHKPNKKAAEEKFNSYFDRIKDTFENDSEYSDLFFNTIEFKDLMDSNQMYFPDKYKKFTDLNLFGKFKGLRGRYLFIENNNDIAAFDINYLIGRYIQDYIQDYQYNFFEEQLSLL